MLAVDRFAWPRASRLLWRKTKRLIEFIAFGLFDAAVLLRCKKNRGLNAVAVLHLRLLGDYVLWLPYGQTMVWHFQQQGKRVVLILNASVLPLARQHFPGCELIGIDRAALLRNLSYRADVLRQLRRLGVEFTCNDFCPRDTLIEDACVRALAAPAWGFDEVFPDRPALDRWWHRRFYAHLLPAMPKVHQSVRHRAFLRALGVDVEEVPPVGQFAAGCTAPIEGAYFVVAPGASRGYKAWPVTRFAEVVRRILAVRPDWRCLVLGTSTERHLGEVIARTCGERVRNLAGETDLLGLVGAIAHAKLVIGNDSAACHLSAACGVPAVAIVGGGHYGRFFPYDPADASVGRVPVAVSEQMTCFGCDWMCRYQAESDDPYPCIAAITPESVWAAVQELFTTQSAAFGDRKPDASHAKAQ